MKHSYEMSINFYGTLAPDFGAKNSTAIRSPLDILSLRIEETEIQYFNLELPIMNTFRNITFFSLVDVFCFMRICLALFCSYYSLLLMLPYTDRMHNLYRVPVPDELRTERRKMKEKKHLSSATWIKY